MNQKVEFPQGVEVVCTPFIEDDQKRILLVQSPKWGDKWVMPGGHVEPGETIAASAVREGEEETGLMLEAVNVFYTGELIHSHSFHRPAHFIYFDVHTKIIGGELKLDDHELTEYQWIKPEDALQLDLGEGYDKAISAFINYKSKITTSSKLEFE